MDNKIYHRSLAVYHTSFYGVIVASEDQRRSSKEVEEVKCHISLNGVRQCGFIPISWKAESELLLPAGNPEAKQESRLAMWYVLSLGKRKPISPH